jgi:hypothetical protein
MLQALLMLVAALGFESVSRKEAHAGEHPVIVLRPGEQRNLAIYGLKRYALGSDAVRARSTEDAVLVKAVRAGWADLWIWKTDGTAEHRPIEVLPRLESPLSPALTRALSKLDEVEIVYTGDGKVVLRGEITQAREAARVRAIRAQVEDQTRISPSLVSAGREDVETWLRSSPWASTLRIEMREDTLWVRGSLDRASEYGSVIRQIRSRCPWTEIEIETLPDSAPTVHFQVYLLELQRSHFSNLGLKWPKSLDGTFQVAPYRGWNPMQLDLALQAMEGEGSARILSRPELVVRAPGDAELFAGGEIPIQATSRNFSNVTWKNFGLTLRLKVSGSAGDRVRLEVFTEVSHLDSTLALNEIPGIQSNRIKTQVDARYGVPLFLSGLLQKGIREQAKGLPALRNIPILGLLFGSQDYLSERSELVAILVPGSTPPRTETEKLEEFLTPTRSRLQPAIEAPKYSPRTKNFHLANPRLPSRRTP